MLRDVTYRTVLGRPQDVIFQHPKDVSRGRPQDNSRDAPWRYIKENMETWGRNFAEWVVSVLIIKLIILR